MSDDVNALIAEAAGWDAGGVAQHAVSALDTIRRLAVALEAVQQAPAVYLGRLVNALGVALANAYDDDSVVTVEESVAVHLVASGILLDAADVWDEGANRMYEFCQEETATSDPDRLPTQPVNPHRAQQVREGDK